MTLKLIIGPTTEPVSLVEAKAQLRIEHSDADALINRMIASAREDAEHELERALITQTWERIVDAFPASELVLGMPPVQSVTSITYVDTAGVQQTMDPADYVLDNDVEPHFVQPAYGGSWPSTLDTANAVRVRFVCGYGDAEDVPQAILQWIQVRIATLDKFRESVIAGVPIAEMPSRFIDRSLDRYRVRSV